MVRRMRRRTIPALATTCEQRARPAIVTCGTDGARGPPTASRPPVARPHGMHLPAMEPSRTFLDSQGVQWWVTERVTRRPADAAGRRCLFFEAAHIIRRVCDYPSDWRALSDAQLERLSWQL